MTILGIDEIGRGPWAGPLCVGAVVLSERFNKTGKPLKTELWQEELTDSKKLTQKKRERLTVLIEEHAIATGLGWVSARELDEIGLAAALKLATRRAVSSLLKIVSDEPITNPKPATKPKPITNPEPATRLRPIINPELKPKTLPFTEIIIDGTSNFLQGTALESLVSVLPKADAKIKEVSAASIIAKVARDNYMKIAAEKFPHYGFEKHVGYGTKFHKTALEQYGPCEEHRLSFKPVSVIAEQFGFQAQTKNKQRKEPLKPNSQSTSHGARAEQIVADYLENQKHHTILAKNHKTRFYEIDIVSATKEHIYFTEVKYRQDNKHGSPLEYIDKKKQEQIKFAAEAFMQYLSKKLKRPVSDLPSPIIAAAAVVGKDFKLDKWLPVIV